jgi:hypothetical protein
MDSVVTEELLMPDAEDKPPAKSEAQAIAESVSRALEALEATGQDSGDGLFRMTDGQLATLRKSLRRAR